MWTSALTAAIVINEIMASNAGSVMSPAINYAAHTSGQTVGRYPDGSSEVVAQQGSQQVYNLKGQAVQGPLAPGIYIMDGRKIIKK